MIRSKYDIDNFLASRSTPVKSIEEIYNSKQYHPSLELFEMLANGPNNPEKEIDYFERYVACQNFSE